MQKWLDATLYPDIDPPSELVSLADRVDFLARLCAAWDFGVVRLTRITNLVGQSQRDKATAAANT